MWKFVILTKIFLYAGQTDMNQFIPYLVFGKIAHASSVVVVMAVWDILTNLYFWLKHHAVFP